MAKQSLKFSVWIALFASLCFGPARAGVMLQGFYKDVPSPAAGTASAPWLWDNIASQANAFRQAGFTAVWIPPRAEGRGGRLFQRLRPV